MRIPIIVSFDKNFILPAQICIYSLLVNANEDTYYEIYVLTSDVETSLLFKKEELERIFTNFKIHFIIVGDLFKDAFEIRDITVAAYYRLMIPEIITNEAKVIYMDVDIILQSDLQDLYSIELNNNYVAGFLDYGMSRSKSGHNYIKNILGIDTETYIQSGFLLMNSHLMRRDKICSKMKSLSRNKYIMQDMDIINIACCNRISVLPPYFNIVQSSLDDMIEFSVEYKDNSSSDILSNSIIHYNGQKPWKGIAKNDSAWWHYYIKSPYFNLDFYKSFQEMKMKTPVLIKISNKLKRLYKRKL